MKVSVIVPSYKRPDYLKRCIKALLNQNVSPYEVIVVLREDDKDSQEVVKEFKSNLIKTVYVNEPGVIVAMNKGLESASGGIVAFTDDDAEPFPDWIEKITEIFKNDNKVGGVGGRDIIMVNGKEVKGITRKIGKIQWFGRAIDYHHLELNPPERIETDVLKGVNMAFRKKFIKGYRFDINMNSITPVSFEIDICFFVKKQGGKIIYTPEVKVKHYSAPRQLGIQRRNIKSVYEYSRNYMYVMLKHLPWLRKLIFITYFFLIGQRASYGPLLFLYDFFRYRNSGFNLLITALKGKWDGLKSFIKYSL